MKQKNLSIAKHALPVSALALLICLFCFPAHAQEKTQTPQASAPAIEEKAEKILQRAIGAMGGSAYLSVRSAVGRGLFTAYRDGVSGIPNAFIDYVIYPDKERTEFRGGGSRIIQTNTGDTGWLYDGAAKTLKDMTPKQVADFKLNMRTNVDNLLRGVWRKEGAQITYAGRREAGLAKRNEALRVTYPDGFTIDFEFSAQDGLPAKVIYKRTNGEGEEIAEEDRLAQFVNTGGINSPFVIDHYAAGIQTSRINYESIAFNTQLPDTLFARPASIKAVK
jgi:hypothetical protein